MPANARGLSAPCRVPVSIAIGSAIAVFAALTILLATFFTVEQRTVAVVQRLGKFVQQAGPVLNLEGAFIDRVAGQVHQRVQQLDAKIETKPDDGLAETRALTQGPAGPTRSESTARGPAAVGLFPGLIDWGHRCGAATWNRDLSRSAQRVSCGVSGGPWPRIDSRLIVTAWRSERGEVA
jgi:hypothetical protein